MYYEVGSGLSKLPETHDGRGENLVGIVSFAEAPSCPALQGLTPAQLHPMRNIHFCKAELYADAAIGSFAIPAKEGMERVSHVAAFCLREDSIVFVDDTTFTEELLSRIMKAAVWQKPALSAFFCTFLDALIEEDLQFLEGFETQLAAVEDEVLREEPRDFETRMALTRHKLHALHRYYSQLSELADTLCASPLFPAEAQHTLRRFSARCGRLEGETQMLLDYAKQVRETYQAQLDLRLNKIMQILTVVTTICMPLTLITGWFGMNFTGMRELAWPYSYPIAIVGSILVVALCFWLCKKKKLL